MTESDEKTLQFEGFRPSKMEGAPPEWIQARLVVLSGPEEAEIYRLTEARTLLGRGADATISLTDPALSRHHAEIVFGGNEFRIRDLQSSNGTLLNGSEVEEYALHNGDKITVGETIMKFEMERADRR